MTVHENQSMLVLVGPYTDGYVVASLGDQVIEEIEQSGAFADGLDLNCPKETGLHVWEGKLDAVNTIDGEYEAVFRGTFRPATAEDLTRFGVPVPRPDEAEIAERGLLLVEREECLNAIEGAGVPVRTYADGRGFLGAVLSLVNRLKRAKVELDAVISLCVRYGQPTLLGGLAPARLGAGRWYVMDAYGSNGGPYATEESARAAVLRSAMEKAKGGKA